MESKNPARDPEIISRFEISESREETETFSDTALA
jgi:hypothetical protein